MFPGPESMDLYGAEWDESVMQFLHFSAISAMLGVLATPVTLRYPLLGV